MSENCQWFDECLYAGSYEECDYETYEDFSDCKKPLILRVDNID